MAISVEQLTAQIIASGLMTADDVAEFVAGLPDDQKPADAKALAKQLVVSKRLTPFQAEQIWKGHGEQLVLGNYVITDKLGQGGMGMVLKATHKLMKRDVALKVLSPDVIKDESAVQRFLREVEAAAKLTHPNIVAAHDADQANGAYFLIMEFVAGRDLSETVKKQGPATIDQAVDFILQAARGLEYAHQNAVVHRDIKPANLLLDDSGTVKVLDMGLARIEDGGVDAATQAALTGTGAIMGTVDYMAPEQAEDTKSAGPQADIYSLGASLYFLLTGKSMVTGTAIGKKLKMLMTGEGLPDSITALRSEVSADLDAVFQKMTAFDMADRYQTMTEVIADLEAIKAGGVPSSASTPGIQPVGVRSDDSAMQSFLDKLGNGTVTTGPTVLATPQAVEASDTMVDSVDDATRPAFKKTATFTKAVTEPKNRKLLIGGALAACLVVGAIIWSLSSDNGGKAKDNSTAIQDGKKNPSAGSSSSAEAPPLAVAPFDEAQAKSHQKAWAKHLGVPVEYTNSVGMKFRLIPPGEFLMGSTAQEIESTLPMAGNNQRWPEWVRSEGPQHRTVLTKPIYIGVTEVTQSEYEQVVGTNPSHFAPSGEGSASVIGLDTGRHPVEMVSWIEATEFCAKLSGAEGLEPFDFPSGGTDRRLGGSCYRLPTEAEWEFACRAGTETRFWTGDDDAELLKAGWLLPNAGKRTHPVGELNANPFGLSDMHGNVWEWVLDNWNAEAYQQFSDVVAVDPSRLSSPQYRHVVRGGLWDVKAFLCRSASRGGSPSDLESSYTGFRAALDVDAVKRAVGSGSPNATGSANVPPPANAPFNEAQAKAHQEAWADHLGEPVEKEVELPGGAKMTFMLIPPGEFMMGSSAKEQQRFLDETKAENGPQDHTLKIRTEGPQRRVRISQPYYLSKTETTQAQWQAILGNNPSKLPSVGHPVNRVSWVDIQTLLKEINKQISTPGTRFTLPTEAQWEHACRAGTTTAWFTGNDVEGLEKYSWFGANQLPEAVGQLAANPWGLHDMLGNVSEWCADYEALYRPSADVVIDPTGPTTKRLGRVYRGGSRVDPARLCRCAARGGYPPDFAGAFRGFRLAMTIDPAKIGKARPINLTPIDLPDGEPGEALRIPHNVIQHPNSNHLGFLSDKLVLTASTNGTPTTFRIRDGATQRKLERAWFDGGKVGAIQFAQSSNHLFGGLSDGRVCLWDIVSGKIEKYFGEPAEASQDNKTFDLSVSSDGKSVAATQPHGLVRVWDVETGRQIGSRQMELQARCAFVPGSRQLALLSGAQLAIWDVVNDRIEKTYPHGLAASTDFRISPDGRYAIACDGRRPAAFCLNLQTGDVRQFSSPDAPAYFATISPDSRWLFAGGILYDLETLQPALDLTKEANGNPNSSWRLVTYAPDGRFLVVHVYSEERSKQAIVFWRLPEKFWPRGTRRDNRVPPPAKAPFNQAQANAHQQAWADHLGLPVKKEVALPGGAKMNLMLIPPGEFLMGSTDEERARLLAEAKAADDTWAIDRIPHEGPQHRVRITKPFYLGKFEVTQAQWQSVMGNNPSHFKDNPTHPVEQVGWDDIQPFLAKLNQSTAVQNVKFVLPTEAQWEYACRSGTTTVYYGGDGEDELKHYGSFGLSSGGKTKPVAELRPNAFGLFDMHGNVSEWCADLFAGDYYAKAPTDDPGGSSVGSNRVYRGGHWFSHAYCRSAFRGEGSPESRHYGIGFRIAATIDATELKTAQTPSANSDRAVAEWVLSLDGFVVARRMDASWTENKEVRNAADLPPGPLVVAEVNFTPSRTFPADELTRLSQLQKLKTLSLNNKRIDDDDLRHLAPLTTITDLYLNGTGVTGAGLAHFKEHSLVIFNCVEPKFSDEGLKQLSRMDRLQAITVKSANITNDGLKHLSDLSKLKVLDISNTPIDDNGLQALTDLKSLQELRLLKTRVTAAGVAALQKALPGCKIEWDGTNTKAAQPDNAKDDSTQ